MLPILMFKGNRLSIVYTWVKDKGIALILLHPSKAVTDVHKKCIQLKDIIVRRPEVNPVQHLALQWPTRCSHVKVSSPPPRFSPVALVASLGMKDQTTTMANSHGLTSPSLNYISDLDNWGVAEEKRQIIENNEFHSCI